MLTTKKLNPELRLYDPAVAEYDFLKCLGRNPLGEVWKVKGPDGKAYQAQFLPLGNHHEALKRLERIHGHPGLPPLEVAQRPSGQVFLLTDYSTRTLRDRFEDCWGKGLSGIPRPELLADLKNVAQVLDLVYLEHQVRHLALQPKNILLGRIQESKIRLDAFGLVELFWLPTHQPVPLLNPRYSAPELYHGHISRECDQYSLALIYAEMATGVHPLRHLPTGGAEGRLNLGLLASGEQEVIARALSANPHDRFASATEMMKALEAAGALAAAQPRMLEPLGPIITLSGAGKASGTLDQFVAELVSLATGSLEVKEFNKIRYALEAGRQLEHRCLIRDFSGAALLKIDGFRQHWGAAQVHQDDNLLILAVHTQPSFWQRLAGRNIGLEIEVRLTSQPSDRRSEVGVVIRPFGCGRRQAARLLEDLGPIVLESIRTYLLAHPEQRTSERLHYSRPLRVCPVVGGIELADPIDCVSKDISAAGIGFLLPHPLATHQVYINLPNVPQLSDIGGLAQIVRKQPRGDGWFEIGAAFNR
jgi:hypothetical protein